MLHDQGRMAPQDAGGDHTSKQDQQPGEWIRCLSGRGWRRHGEVGPAARGLRRGRHELRHGRRDSLRAVRKYRMSNLVPVNLVDLSRVWEVLGLDVVVAVADRQVGAATASGPPPALDHEVKRPHAGLVSVLRLALVGGRLPRVADEDAAAVRRHLLEETVLLIWQCPDLPVRERQGVPGPPHARARVQRGLPAEAVDEIAGLGQANRIQPWLCSPEEAGQIVPVCFASRIHVPQRVPMYTRKPKRCREHGPLRRN
mmetsp:Transcript_112042/g.317266  ORF Transcript_112042/g.317266 Transcript_112042/m.317266 type:complete len:256 (-) Transcript_112042:588-1355(-)